MLAERLWLVAIHCKLKPLYFKEIKMKVDMVHLSESTSGRGIKIVATATAGTAIDTAVAGATSFDRYFLWAVNSHNAAVDLTLEMGGVTDPDDLITYDAIPVEVGRVMVCDGYVLNGGLDVAGFASIANVIVISGYKLRYS